MSSLPDDVLAGGVIRSTEMNAVLAALRLIYGDVQVKDVSYPVLASDFAILADDTSGSIDITLPAATSEGKVYLIVKTNSSANHVMILTTGSDNIDGHSAMQLDTQYDKLLLLCDGLGNWLIVSSIGTPH